MKRLLILLNLLFLFTICESQIGRYPFSTAPVSEEGYCSEYQAVYDAMTTPPGADTANAQNTLVKTLVDNGIWEELDLFYVFAQRTETDALLNWINHATFTCVNMSETVFVKYEGFTGDGSADYLDTEYNASTSATNYSLNDASFGGYFRVDVNENKVVAGTYSSSDNIFLKTKYNNGTYFAINDQSFTSSSNTNSTGFYVVNRPSSSIKALWKNGSNLGNNSVNSVAVPAQTFSWLANRNGGTPATNQISIGFVGGSLSDTDIPIMNTAVETYMDYLGKGVQ